MNQQSGLAPTSSFSQYPSFNFVGSSPNVCDLQRAPAKNVSKRHCGSGNSKLVTSTLEGSCDSVEGRGTLEVLASQFANSIPAKEVRIQSAASLASSLNCSLQVALTLNGTFNKQTDLAFSAPLTISEKDFDIVREDILAMIKKLVSKLGESKSETPACFNIDFFKIKS